MLLSFLLLVLSYVLPMVDAHASIFTTAMWGLNITSSQDPHFGDLDNRPVAPLMGRTFDSWWFHGLLDFPPKDGEIFPLPAGQPATMEIACTKSATSFFDPADGGDTRDGDNVCPGAPMSEYHTTGPDDLKGCALAIAYNNDPNAVQPEEMTVFSVNDTCVFHRFTDFQVPAKMPACPPGGCVCAWMWIHSEDSGSEQNYMTGFRCNITDATSTVALAKPEVPRRCGADPKRNKPNAVPGNCTYGAKQPLYWFQAEKNNMFEDQYTPPFYNDLYNFLPGAQNDIFADSYPNGLPTPSENNTVIPTPFLGSSASAPATPPAQATSAPISSGSPQSTSSSSKSSSSSSPASSSTLLSISSSATPSSSAIPTSTSSTVPQSVSIMTVTSTQVVTVMQTQSAAPPVSSAISSSSSQPSTTVFSTAFVTVTASASAPPSLATGQSSVALSSPSIAPSSTLSASSSFATPPVDVASSAIASVISLNKPHTTATPSGGAAQANSTAERFANLEALGEPNNNDGSGGNPSDSSTPSTLQSPPSMATMGVNMCKRNGAGSSTSLRKRSAWALPGMGSHRRLTKRSNIWNLFY